MKGFASYIKALLVQKRHWQRIHQNTRCLSPFREAVGQSAFPLSVATVQLNSLYFLPEFLSHYRTEGVVRFDIIDNGSDDGTIEFLAAQPDVNLLICQLPFSIYGVSMRTYLMERFSFDQFVLQVDPDEFVHVPLGLTFELVSKYMQRREYNAVVSQVLDMFSDTNIATQGSQVSPFQQIDYRFYELNSLRKESYIKRWGAKVTNPHIGHYFGGIRGRLFGLPNLALTKHSLFKWGRGMVLPNIHQAMNVYLADFDLPLLHYKFHPYFGTQIVAALQHRQFYQKSQEYEAYCQLFSNQESFFVDGQFSLKLESIQDLADNGFVLCPDFFYT